MSRNKKNYNGLAEKMCCQWRVQVPSDTQLKHEQELEQEQEYKHKNVHKHEHDF